MNKWDEIELDRNLEWLRNVGAKLPMPFGPHRNNNRCDEIADFFEKLADDNRRPVIMDTAWTR